MEPSATRRHNGVFKVPQLEQQLVQVATFFNGVGGDGGGDNIGVLGFVIKGLDEDGASGRIKGSEHKWVNSSNTF
jgi:hypothetical protein